MYDFCSVWYKTNANDNTHTHNVAYWLISINQTIISNEDLCSSFIELEWISEVSCIVTYWEKRPAYLWISTYTCIQILYSQAPSTNTHIVGAFTWSLGFSIRGYMEIHVCAWKSALIVNTLPKLSMTLSVRRHCITATFMFILFLKNKIS